MRTLARGVELWPMCVVHEFCEVTLALVAVVSTNIDAGLWMSNATDQVTATCVIYRKWRRRRGVTGIEARLHDGCLVAGRVQLIGYLGCLIIPEW